MFHFLLTPFDTRGYHFELNLSLMLLIKQPSNVALKSSKHEELKFTGKFFSVFIHFSTAMLLLTNSLIKGRFRNRYKWGRRLKT